MPGSGADRLSHGGPLWDTAPASGPAFLKRLPGEPATLGSYDITGEALERHASHQVAGFLAGWAG
jgi:hypothetical protein